MAGPEVDQLSCYPYPMHINLFASMLSPKPNILCTTFVLPKQSVLIQQSTVKSLLNMVSSKSGQYRYELFILAQPLPIFLLVVSIFTLFAWKVFVQVPS